MNITDPAVLTPRQIMEYIVIVLVNQMRQHTSGGHVEMAKIIQSLNADNEKQKEAVQTMDMHAAEFTS